MKKGLLMTLCLSFLLTFFAWAGLADSAIGSVSAPAYAGKLFDDSYVHHIDIRLTDENWTDLLNDPISKTKYASDIVIDGETFANVTVSTKGFSSLYLFAYVEE